MKRPAEANIHLVNTKSQLKPFTVITPQDHAIFNVYNGELRRDVSMYPWWNHWHAAQKPSDGRYAMADDNPSHSSLSNINWDAYELTENTHPKIMLHGLTNGKAEGLIPVTKSWSSPAALKSLPPQYSGGNYDPTERAYQITCLDNTKAADVNFTLEATDASPIENACFVIKNWGNRDISLKIDDKAVARSKAFRYGFRDTAEGTDLVIWLEKKTTKAVKVSLSVAKN